MIKIENATLIYPNCKGVFDLNFSIKQGEVIGYLGPNGAGKTTTMRMLMGFMKPDKGYCTIDGKDCFSDASEIQKILGFLPGEISFLEGMHGNEYLKLISELRGMKDLSYQEELLDMFEFSPKGLIKKYSKGMKQKLAIVASFMHDPKLLLLDEPTSGLDPLMQNRFVELILKEKSKGKTILMSSHIFEEIERCCDHVLIIKDGRIITKSDINTLKSSQRKVFTISSKEPMEQAISVFKNEGFEIGNIEPDCFDVFVLGKDMDKFGKTMTKISLLNLETKKQGLENLFLRYYSKKEK